LFSESNMEKTIGQSIFWVIAVILPGWHKVSHIWCITI
jgi:hypothetical protein